VVLELDRLVSLLPPGTLEVARRWCPPGRLDRMTRDLVLPLAIEPDWPGPADPLAVGDGWVQADITDDDRDTLDRLRATMPNATAEQLATAAQTWRLPVLPYRPLPTNAAPSRPLPSEEFTGSGMSMAGLKVVDLSSLWAGPLCTQLLADAGAEVTKVDPDCRPDGFRERPHLYAQLNTGKTIVDLDLRRPNDRDAFEDLLRHADLLVDSFSRRVLPNLGYDAAALQRLNPTMARVSIVAFPTGCPEQDWLAYGSGIHAVSGLGLATGRAKASAVAYPDSLTGYAAFHAARSVVDAARHGTASAGSLHRSQSAYREVSLWEAAAAVVAATNGVHQ
jgi:hypothetical protein